jgi:NADPH-dependent ferric siderophore reductase
VQLQWVSNEAQCLAAVRAWQRPAGEGFAWCAGEAASMAALRRVLVEEQGVERHAVRAAAYWKRDAVAFHENLGESA